MLDLSGCALGLSGCLKVLEAASQAYVERLIMPYNITERHEDDRAIAEAVEAASSLSFVDLSYNKLSERTRDCLLVLAKTRPESIKTELDSVSQSRRYDGVVIRRDIGLFSSFERWSLLLFLPN